MNIALKGESLGPYCPDCGGLLKTIPDKYFKEGTRWYKCIICGAEWEYDYGGIIPYSDGPRIKRVIE